MYTIPAESNLPWGTTKRWRLLPHFAGSEFLLSFPLKREVMRMYITLEQLTGIFSVLIALVGLVYMIVSNSKKK